MLATNSNTYIEIRNDDASFYFKMKSNADFESWYVYSIFTSDALFLNIRKWAFKRHIEYCNWLTYIDCGGDEKSLKADVSAWVTKMYNAKENYISELQSGDILVCIFDIGFYFIFCVSRILLF